MAYAGSVKERKAYKAAYNKQWQLKNREKLNAYNRAYRAAHPEETKASSRKQNLKQRARALPKLYGISENYYNLMLLKQDGKCAICQLPPTDKIGRLCVDHCHDTGFVRGLLCRKCNTGIGQFGDNPDRLAIAVAYLEQNVDDTV